MNDLIFSAERQLEIFRKYKTGISRVLKIMEKFTEISGTFATDFKSSCYKIQNSPHFECTS